MACQVDVDHAVPIFFRMIEERLDAAGAGVVHEYVDAAEGLQRLLAHPQRVVPLADIDLHRQRSP